MCPTSRDSDFEVPRERGVFCNRTLNMRAIRAIGYDMDYTLVHYRSEEWERRAYERMRQRLVDQGWPVTELEFDPTFVTRGLVIDTQLGNIVKANRFGFVRRAFHGSRPLDFETQRRVYARTVIDLAEPRYVFLNTLFSLSEACLFAQLVDLLDVRRLPEVLGYEALYRRVRALMDEAHMEGEVKADIIREPDRFVMLDPEVAATLVDQQAAGKKLMLITNSEWSYTAAMMSYSFDRFLPDGLTWQALFDVVIVGARKPEFFESRAPLFEVVSPDGLLRPASRGLRDGGTFLGGSARLVEQHLRLSGDEILYVGDHIYGDVRVVKSLVRWRTALIVRELEGDILAAEAQTAEEAELAERMLQKERLERLKCRIRLELLRRKTRRPHVLNPALARGELARQLTDVRALIAALDDKIAPLARALSGQANANWGPLMRAGNDKSHFARQVERSADIYTSRVGNLMFVTPFAFLRSPRGSLPHDPAAPPPGPDRPGDAS